MALSAWQWERKCYSKWIGVYSSSNHPPIIFRSLLSGGFFLLHRDFVEKEYLIFQLKLENWTFKRVLLYMNINRTKLPLKQDWPLSGGCMISES